MFLGVMVERRENLLQSLTDRFPVLASFRGSAVSVEPSTKGESTSGKSAPTFHRFNAVSGRHVGEVNQKWQCEMETFRDRKPTHPDTNGSILDLDEFIRAAIRQLSEFYRERPVRCLTTGKSGPFLIKALGEGFLFVSGYILCFPPSPRTFFNELRFEAI
jgi:hypothetical protein